MCTVCGCSAKTEAMSNNETLSIHHDHDLVIDNTRIVKIEQDILSRNNALASNNRALFIKRGVFSVNLVSSPGSGKTELLTRTLTDLVDYCPMTVIEGDQQTANDAERIRKTGIPVTQINTGKGCHLDARMIGRAVMELNVMPNSLLFIENVGNLVCPAAFDLGESRKIVLLSVTEGEDKPLKYPDIFHAADLMLINKIDLLPYLNFNIEKSIEYAQHIKPDLNVLQISATTGEGMEAWYDFIRAGHTAATRSIISE